MAHTVAPTQGEAESHGLMEHETPRLEDRWHDEHRRLSVQRCQVSTIVNAPVPQHTVGEVGNRLESGPTIHSSAPGTRERTSGQAAKSVRPPLRSNSMPTNSATGRSHDFPRKIVADRRAASHRDHASGVATVVLEHGAPRPLAHRQHAACRAARPSFDLEQRTLVSATQSIPGRVVPECERQRVVGVDYEGEICENFVGGES